MAALKLAARYPLSIVIVKTGSSPDKGLENLALGKGRFFDNVTLVDFKDVAAKDTKTREDYMALQCMKKVPTQYAILKKKQGYMPPAEVPVFEDPAWEDERRYQESLQTEAKLLVFGRNAKTGPVRLGRGAFWDPLTKQLYYTDILGKLVHIYNEEGKTDTVINACGTVGFAVPDENGKLYVGTNAGIELVDGLDVTKVDTKKNSGDYWISPYADIEKGKKAKTINCGTVDAKGRIWVTTGETSVQLREPTGGIFCCHGEQMVFTPLEAGLTHIGGIAFSIDGKTLYAADLSLNSIWAYEHDVSTGVLSKPRVLFEATTQVKGVVSDVCLDTEGKLWVPHLGGGAVVRYNPEDGKAIKIMRVPSLLCDSVAFGGENLEKLYIVTGSETVSMDREYYAGSLFVIDSVGVRGAPIRPFKPKVNDNNAGGSQNPAEGGAAADEAEGKEQGEESTLSEPLENKHSLDSGGDKDEIGS
uniref:SMP-30/Gluconolactonase/LRE-like region domain-containing protein n=2 Tax=Lotharella globosa TaxID=91324 RepID=A0A7S3ZFU0_9EUKA